MSDERVVLITGGAKRVGAAISRRLHAEGARVMIHYRSSVAEADDLAAELNGRRPGTAALVQADLLHEERLPELVQATVERFGRLDVLINNASSFYATALGEITREAWDDLIGTNLKAPLFLAQAAMHELRRTRGCIVNIADIHAERPLKSYVVYNLGKAGLVALTKSLARELGPEVRVNAIAPGAIIWPEDGQHFDDEARRQILDQVFLGRVGSPEDIAAAAHFLIAEAPYVTAHVLAVDGGRAASI